MTTTTKKTAASYSPEVRERAVRLVLEGGGEGASDAVGGYQLGGGPDRRHDGDTLRQWVRQAERDGGQRPGPTTDERARMAALEREVRELRQADEILRKASA